MVHRLVAALFSALVIVSLGAGVALAGEVTGTGKLLTIEDGKWGTGLHGRSECAYSGQEVQQYYENDDNTGLKPVPTKGIPAHSQTWGQIPKDFRDFLTAIGSSPGVACNPTRAQGGAE